MITTTAVHPPAIKQMFSSDLLCQPAKLHDDETTLWKIYEKIQKMLAKRSEQINVKCRKLESQFLELYERIKAKKAAVGSSAKNKTKEPLYRIECPNKSDRAIFTGLRHGGSFMALLHYRKNHAVQKTYRKMRKK